MASPSERLAASLEVLRQLENQGKVAIRSADLGRTHRERLVANGFLVEVLRGWYLASRPDEARGGSRSWYVKYWDFCASYLEARFGAEWCLSAEQSLSLHAGNWAVPRQLTARSPRGGNTIIHLPQGTSLVDARTELPPEAQRQRLRKLRVFSLPAALVAVGPATFFQRPTDARAALTMVRDASDVLAILLDGGHSVVAGRLAGAFRNIGRDRIANDILRGMRAAGYTVNEGAPFEDRSPLSFSARDASPYTTRLRLMWHQMRGDILAVFPPAPEGPVKIERYLASVEEAYSADAYHSLSIEGYRVSPELIERVRRGDYNPEAHAGDRSQRDAMAARGYFEAFQVVKGSVEQVLRGANPGEVVDRDHTEWCRALFAPSVRAGLVRAADLAGYRNDQVYIRGSMHVPPPREAVRDLMPVFFGLLGDETAPPVRVVLGHFAFAFIHPYMDGNGRVARFLTNVMLAAAGYPWTIVPVEQRHDYMQALEQASVDHEIRPFAELLGSWVEKGTPRVR